MALRVDPDLISADGVTRILRMVAQGAERTLSAPQSTLATLWQSDEQELAPSLFPAGMVLATAA